MGMTSDLRILYQLIFTKPPAGADHAARLEAFYQAQSDGYDDFRRRLLHGREEMMRGLDLPAGARLVDMGGGTGSNLEALGDRLTPLGEVTIVDLCPSLLKVADTRIQKNGWTNVRTVVGDATKYEPEGGPVDAVTFSYSLTMIPDWFRAIDHAHRLLKPGGLFGAVDFYVSRKWVGAGMRKHSALERWFWPTWFGWDNVWPSPDHLPYLQSKFRPVRVEEWLGKVPYLLGLKAPYYIFLGRKE